MQYSYKNPSPFFYNNLYRKNWYKNRFPYYYSNSSSLNPLTMNSSNSCLESSNSQSNINLTKNPNINLPPNKDFVLDIFGLKLYFDDVLILSLLFFLYKEDVKDNGLFLALVLLLIS